MMVFFAWILRAPLINIPLFIVGIFLFFLLLSQRRAHYLFIPAGWFAQILEFFLWLVILFAIFVIYKKRNEPVDECAFFLLHKPLVKVVLNSVTTIFMTYFAYFLILQFAHRFDMAINNRTLEARILHISNWGKKRCRPLAKTDILHHYHPHHQTLFYKFVNYYSFDKICLRGKHLQEGQTVVLDIKESPFGISVDRIEAKVY